MPLCVSSVSPFSARCNYSIRFYPCSPRPPGTLTPWEQEIVGLIKSTGAAAFSQVCANDKQRLKLKKLCRAGVLCRIRLEGTYTLEVAFHGEFPGLAEILKSLCVTRLALLVQPHFQKTEIARHPSGYIFHLDGKPFFVIVHREDENPLLAVNIANQYDRSIILAEEYHPEFAHLKNARILLDNTTQFLQPDGRPD